MRIGILASGLMGGKLGTIFTRAGHEVVFTYARSNEKLKWLARDARNTRAGAPAEAAAEADARLRVEPRLVDADFGDEGGMSGQGAGIIGSKGAV